MATPVEPTPPMAPGAAPAGAPVPEPPAGPASPPDPTPEPPGGTPAPDPNGLPTPAAPDGTQTSGKGSHQDHPPTPNTPAASVDPSQQAQPESNPPKADRPEVKDLPDWAQELIKDTRAEVAKSRVEAKTQAADEARKQMAEDIGRALGIITDDTPDEEKLNPEQLRDLLAGERTTARMARTELAVYRAAQAAGGSFNANALLDSRAFLDSIGDIDPTNSEALTAKIAEAVKANPWLQMQPTQTPEPQQQTDPTGQQQPAAPVVPVVPKAPPAPPSGGQFAGGPGAQPVDLSSMSIDDFRNMRREARR